MIVRSCVEKHAKNIMRMGTHKIVGQMGKVDPKHQLKMATLEKWLFMLQNWKHYKCPHVVQPNLHTNPT